MYYLLIILFFVLLFRYILVNLEINNQNDLIIADPEILNIRPQRIRNRAGSP